MKLIRNGNEFILKYGGETILEYSKDRPMIYAGREKKMWICTAAIIR